MIEMDIYERESQILTISNLAAIKAFHDAGVDVTELGIRDYSVDVHYNMDTSMDILIAGCEKLIEGFSFRHYEELEEIEERFQDGIPECAIFIKNEKLFHVVKSKYKKELEATFTTSNFSFEYSDVSFELNSEEVIISMWFGVMIHEVVIAIIDTNQKINELHAHLMEEKKNGVSNNLKRQAV